jgi:hypothetical protein
MPATYAQLESALRLIASGIRPDLRSKVRAKVMTRQELVGIAQRSLGVRVDRRRCSCRTACRAVLASAGALDAEA